MSNSAQQFLDECNRVLKESSVFQFITRDAALQARACQTLKDLLSRIAREKASAIAGGHEDYANALLGCECAARATISEIQMWILLKEGRPDDAWDRLVDAQDSLSLAVRAHNALHNLEQLVTRLDVVEQLVFPPQVFMSAGMVVDKQICSVCGEDYDNCAHIKGRPYMGEFCTVRLIPSKVNEVSIVDAPADKRCRVLNFSDDGGYRNRMTWRVEQSQGKTTDGEKGATSSVILATPHTLEE